ncbi:DUF5131 family protein [Phycicoccus sonneratiae]|uniref:DUF5131 family protein n=1 Tax=Phycicoccus sonneratiae TaxID=2807628 RepID=UPI0027DDD04D|nr:DUF5131 family protein [Phycicoccus sonneraticus]
MSDKSAIEWTEATWNPVTGCDRISEGCDNCYALALAKRLKAMGVQKYQNDGDPRTSGPGFGVTVHPAALDQPLRWRSPRVVFVNSMSDLFHAKVRAMNRDLTFAGVIVLAPSEADESPTSEQKAVLDALHLRKIDLADRVVIVNPAGTSESRHGERSPTPRQPASR